MGLPMLPIHRPRRDIEEFMPTDSFLQPPRPCLEAEAAEADTLADPLPTSSPTSSDSSGSSGTHSSMPGLNVLYNV